MRARRRDRRGEALDDPCVSVVEDPLQVALHEEAVHDAAAGLGVMHVVDDDRVPVDLFEHVLVDPLSIRTPHLAIDETIRWLERRDLGPPADGDPVKPQAVLDAMMQAGGNGRKLSSSCFLRVR